MKKREAGEESKTEEQMWKSNAPKRVLAKIKKGLLTRDATGNDNTGDRFMADV